MPKPVKLTEIIIDGWTSNWTIPFDEFSKEEYTVIAKQILENQDILNMICFKVKSEIQNGKKTINLFELKEILEKRNE